MSAFSAITEYLFGKRLVAAVGGLFLMCICIFGSALALAEMGDRGIDRQIGEVGASLAEVSVDDAIPSIGRMVGPAADVLARRAQPIMKSLPQISFNRTPVVGETTIRTGPAAVSETPAIVVTPQPTGCTNVNTPLSLQALTLWKQGKAEEAASVLERSDANDCLAQGLWKDYVQPWQSIWSVIMPGTTSDPVALATGAVQCAQLNSRFVGCYYAAGWARYLQFAQAPNAEKAQQALAGFTVTVGDRKATGDWAFLADQNDMYVFIVQAGLYGGTTEERASDITKFLGWLGIKWSSGDGSKTFTIEGVLVPENIPDPMAPLPDAYKPGFSVVPVPQNTPIVVPPVQVTPQGVQAQPAGDQVVCHYTGSGSGLYLAGWAGEPPRNTTLEVVKQLNPGLWERYVADTTQPQDVVFPAGTICGQ